MAPLRQAAPVLGLHAASERSKAAKRLLKKLILEWLESYPSFTARPPSYFPDSGSGQSRVTGAPFSRGCLTVLLATSSSEDPNVVGRPDCDAHDTRSARRSSWRAVAPFAPSSRPVCSGPPRRRPLGRRRETCADVVATRARGARSDRAAAGADQNARALLAALVGADRELAILLGARRDLVLELEADAELGGEVLGALRVLRVQVEHEAAALADQLPSRRPPCEDTGAKSRRGWWVRGRATNPNHAVVTSHSLALSSLTRLRVASLGAHALTHPQSSRGTCVGRIICPRRGVLERAATTHDDDHASRGCYPRR